MDAIAQTHRGGAVAGLMSRVRDAMAAQGAHAARTVVLLPYVHLLPVARDAWAAAGGDGFAPRFETTSTWARSFLFDAEADGLTFDMGRDVLAARALLAGASLQSQADLLAPRLVEAAWQLAPVAAAQAPGERASWAAQVRGSIAFDAPALALESAVARIALEWTAASSYATDVLFARDVLEDVELLVVLEGLQHDPLARSVAAALGGRAATFALATPAPLGNVRLHEARDPSDEAERAAACAVAHVNAGRAPVALAAVDRQATRRIHAMLRTMNVAVRDETGWKLSTTRRAADVMLALQACAWDASSDSVIDWIKNCPAIPPFSSLLLERRVRRAEFVREWQAFHVPDDDGSAAARTYAQVNAWREGMQGARALGDWIASLRGLLEASGQWAVLERDPAGAVVIDALQLAPARQEEVARMPQSQRRWTLAEFTSWADDALEAATFKPEAEGEPQVVILPVSQLLARPFGALVMPGCDELRLVASPEPPGLWTPALRALLGMPSREAIEAQTRASWDQALQIAECDLLWRTTDESGEPLLAGALVQQLRLEHGLGLAPDPRERVEVAARPAARANAVGRLLPLTQLSPSGYIDLRTCPYRFFAMRLLALQEAQELDTDVEKRHFGNWLHKVLSTFHERLKAEGGSVPGDRRVAMLENASDDVTRLMCLDEGEFLPFRSSWPKVRDAYLAWLADHEAQEGARYEESEQDHEVTIAGIRLFGRIDRIDRLPDGRRYLIDYKTEDSGKSRDRVKDFAEDTQLAFYAALLEDDTVRAAYVNVGERETKTVEQKAIVDGRDLLVAGLVDDVARIAAGEAMPAHGEGRVCDFCGARGICRKDSWS